MRYVHDRYQCSCFFFIQGEVHNNKQSTQMMIRCEICKEKFDHSNIIGVYKCGHMVHLSCHQMYVNAAREQNGNGNSSITEEKRTALFEASPN